MKLADGLIARSVMDEHVLVSAGAAKDKFQGVARSNGTAAFIIDCLKEETSRDEIVEKMFETFEAPRDVIASDVDDFLAELRKIGALDD